MFRGRLPCQVPPCEDTARVEGRRRRVPQTSAQGSDEMTDELIARLAAANPVPREGTLHVLEPVRLRRSWRPVLGVAVAVAALAGAGIAIAAGFGAFNGISAAQHPQTGADVIDPATM